MGRLAVIGTFYGRHENSLPLLHRLYVDTTCPPDEAWLMCETPADAEALFDAYWELYDKELLHEWPEGLYVVVLRTPKDGNTYRVIPYSNKINWALDLSNADFFVYLDNNSMPGQDKYRVMKEALEANPDWGAVFCTQHRTGFDNAIYVADVVVHDAFCVLNYTQVMHRRSTARWPLEMALANPDLADATFWRRLHADFGPFHPAGGDTVHDFHHIPDPKAVGV